MSSLKGAPSLQRAPVKQFSFDAVDDYYEDDFVNSEDVETGTKNDKSDSKKDSSSKKKKKKEKEKKKGKEKKKDKKKGEAKGEKGNEDLRDSGVAAASSGVRSGGDTSRNQTSSAVEDDDDDFGGYSEDFDDDVSPVASSVASVREGNARETLGSAQPSTSDGLLPEQVMKIFQSQEAQLKHWREEQEQREKFIQVQQEALRAQMDELKTLYEHKGKGLVADLTSQVRGVDGAAVGGGGGLSDTAAQQHASQSGGQIPVNSETQRRQRRERERALHLRRLEQEEAARTLFQRLAQDVREVFHELNLSVVASEKERLLKDERYRKEREVRDRREEMERREWLQKEVKEREERFWSAMEEREERFRALVDSKVAKDEEERESRRKRDLEDREERAKNDRELRNEIMRMEIQRREHEDANMRERDQMVIQSQVEDMRRRYDTQLEEVRRQFELDRAHAEEMHRMEIEAIQKRHAESTAQKDRAHMSEVGLFEAHTKNAAELERIIEHLHKDMEATRKMNETLTEERLEVIRHKEQLVSEQKTLVDTVLEELRYTKQEMEKERARVASLYAKFDIGLSNFTKEASEERRRCQEAQSRYETLREQLEKDRRLMLHEVSQERKLFEQQYEDFMAKKLQAITELQEERMAIARERTEAAMLRERRNNDEAELLKSLRAQEEAYMTKMQGIDDDRMAISEMRMEQKRICDEVAAEREALREERRVFEEEKVELLRRFQELQLRAAETSAMNERLRLEMGEQSQAKLKATPESREKRAAVHADPIGPSGATSVLQADLSRQRAILQRISKS
ncbi:hypothetical protein ERJ75_000731700 [Trypanosoma vivax]|uniref:Fas-binding factor 1 C-terminal domain-containing protein n=1 Tax=Trypanosoma vivax (strain Y486) TaxID=1055687 RepID=G0TX76_TRYVY|nr:hypothetical protein TRVL_00634 [Trypanosoma vivax]KAH8614141.1 hypothetical protein ERJ75_000731700 [Trypanosoma vivax]CCC48566.1 conserved hypothetical protein [Trypanosoma vivax Y486]